MVCSVSLGLFSFAEMIVFGFNMLFGDEEDGNGWMTSAGGATSIAVLFMLFVSVWSAGDWPALVAFEGTSGVKKGRSVTVFSL